MKGSYQSVRRPNRKRASEQPFRLRVPLVNFPPAKGFYLMIPFMRGLAFDAWQRHVQSLYACFLEFKRVCDF